MLVRDAQAVLCVFRPRMDELLGASISNQDLAISEERLRECVCALVQNARAWFQALIYDLPWAWEGLVA